MVNRITTRPARSAFQRGPLSLFVRLPGMLRAAWTLHKERIALSRLDDTLLRDIGVTREKAELEAARPVWQVPKHWQGH